MRHQKKKNATEIPSVTRFKAKASAKFCFRSMQQWIQVVSSVGNKTTVTYISVHFHLEPDLWGTWKVWAQGLIVSPNKAWKILGFPLPFLCCPDVIPPSASSMTLARKFGSYFLSIPPPKIPATGPPSTFYECHLHSSSPYLIHHKMNFTDAGSWSQVGTFLFPVPPNSVSPKAKHTHDFINLSILNQEFFLPNPQLPSKFKGLQHFPALGRCQRKMFSLCEVT